MLWGYLIGYGYLAVLLGTAEFVNKRTRIPVEVTRKVLHCLIGLEWLVLYFFFADTWQIVIIPATFIVVNALSYRFRWFKSIERDTDNHLGTVFYALAMTAMSVATAIDGRWMIPFGVATFCLSFGDAAAALAGKYLRPNRPIFDKSFNGVLFCFLFAFLAQIVLFAILGRPYDWPWFAVIAAVCALTELLSGKGLDNVFICAWCCVFAYAITAAPHLLIPVLHCFGGFVLCCLTYRARLFTLPAAILGGVMLATVGLCGSWVAYLTILGCYALTAVVERACHCRHSRPRNSAQVLQNGLAAWVVVVIYRFYAHPALLYAFIVAVSQSMCDSLASAIGSTAHTDPVNIVTHQRQSRGTSGAISLRGTLLASALTVLPALGGYFVQGWHVALIFLVALPSLGMLFDSFLGAALQRKNRCDVCGEITECTVHCARPTRYALGLKHLSNGGVNLVANLSATLAAVAILLFVA